jgi:hypothetical protein
MAPATCAATLLMYARMTNAPELTELDNSVDGAITEGLFGLQTAMVLVALNHFENEAVHKLRAASIRECFEKMISSEIPVEYSEGIKVLIAGMRIRVIELSKYFGESSAADDEHTAAAREWWEELFEAMTGTSLTGDQAGWTQGLKLWTYSSLQLKSIRGLVSELVVDGKLIDRS